MPNNNKIPRQTHTVQTHDSNKINIEDIEEISIQFIDNLNDV